jgi:hypothetical protein
LIARLDARYFQRNSLFVERKGREKDRKKMRKRKGKRDLLDRFEAKHFHGTGAFVEVFNIVFYIDANYFPL